MILAKVTAVQAHGLMFHHFFGPAHPKGQGAIDAETFERILQHVGIENIVTPEEWIFLAKRDALPVNAVCLTFDDGLLCQYEIALPVLKKYGLKAFWFIYSGPLLGSPDRLEIYRYFRTTCFDSIDDFYKEFERTVVSYHADRVLNEKSKFCQHSYLSEFPFYTDSDRWFRYLRDEVLTPDEYFSINEILMKKKDFDRQVAARKLWMSAEQIASLSRDGHQIGLHSTTHPTRLDRLEKAKQKYEYETNYRHLAEITGCLPVSMSHPCNSYGPETIEVLADLGIQIGFRSNMSKIDPVAPLLEMSREDHANLLRQVACGWRADS